MKKIISILLAVCLMCGLGSAFAINEGEARVVIGADNSDSQISSVYNTFGISRGDVTELTLTNSEERQYLEGVVSSDVIGTKSISCVYIKILAPGSGLDVTTSNITWCGKEMYVNALVTAGIDDARVIVTAPFGVSGTAALTGIYKAYEDITGVKLDSVAKQVATEELVITADLADQIGEYDSTQIVNELKLILDETRNMTDDEVRAEIRKIAADYDVSITDDQVNQLLTLCRSFETLGFDELKEKVEGLQDTLKKLSSVEETAGGIVSGIKNFFSAIGNFFSNLFGGSKD